MEMYNLDLENILQCKEAMLFISLRVFQIKNKKTKQNRLWSYLFTLAINS